MKIKTAIIIGMTSCAEPNPAAVNVCMSQRDEVVEFSTETCELPDLQSGLTQFDAESGTRQRSIHLEGVLKRMNDVPHTEVDEIIDAALSVEKGPITAELLLALAWHESRFDRQNRTGSVCGMLQVVPDEVGEEDFETACNRWSSDIRSAFQAGVDEFLGNPKMSKYNGWLRGIKGHVSRERLIIALRHRACGNKIPCGKDQWIRSVISMMEMLQGD